MKMKKTAITILSLLVTFLIMQGCSGSKESLKRLYKGDSDFDPSIATPLTIQEILDNASDHAGSFVVVEGKVSTICSVGCWFYLQDTADNEIYVNLAPQNFNVPQSAVGKMVKVTGVLEAGEGNYKISAYEIEFTEVKE